MLIKSQSCAFISIYSSKSSDMKFNHPTAIFLQYSLFKYSFTCTHILNLRMISCTPLWKVIFRYDNNIGYFRLEHLLFKNFLSATPKHFFLSNKSGSSMQIPLSHNLSTACCCFPKPSKRLSVQ